MKPRACMIDESTVTPESGEDPGTSWRTLMSAGVTPTTQLTSGVCEIAPGGQLLLHRHPPLEIYYFTAGRGLVTLGDAVHEVGPGVAISIPGDLPHGVRNTGSEALKFFYVFPVDSFAEVVYTNL